jgi:hypothetical protein
MKIFLTFGFGASGGTSQVPVPLYQYIGVGFLSLESNWINFIINYLDIDRAEQGGDTILTIFDRNFNWAVSFTLIQDDNILKIEKYEKQKNGI